jgi:hypothetical protein
MLDFDRDEEQSLGFMPEEVVAALWPGFVPQDYEIHINGAVLKKHLRRHEDWEERVATLRQYPNEIASALSNPYVFARYDKVGQGEAGITVYVEVVRVSVYELRSFLAVGVRMFKPVRDDGKENHVATVIPPTPERRFKSRLRKVRYFQPSGSSL